MILSLAGDKPLVMTELEISLTKAVGSLCEEVTTLREALREILRGHPEPRKRAAEAISRFEAFRTVALKEPDAPRQD